MKTLIQMYYQEDNEWRVNQWADWMRFIFVFSCYCSCSVLAAYDSITSVGIPTLTDEQWMIVVQKLIH